MIGASVKHRRKLPHWPRHSPPVWLIPNGLWPGVGDPWSRIWYLKTLKLRFCSCNQFHHHHLSWVVSLCSCIHVIYVITVKYFLVLTFLSFDSMNREWLILTPQLCWRKTKSQQLKVVSLFFHTILKDAKCWAMQYLPFISLPYHPSRCFQNHFAIVLLFFHSIAGNKWWVNRR